MISLVGVKCVPIILFCNLVNQGFDLPQIVATEFLNDVISVNTGVKTPVAHCTSALPNYSRHS